MESKQNKMKSQIINYALHFLWPVSCPVCGAPAEIICDDCIKSLFAEKIISRNLEGRLEVKSPSWYHTRINKIISAFKYSGARELCRPVGRIMGEFLERPEADYLLPVPLHLKSERKYNQARELAKGLSDSWRLEIFDGAEWSKVVPNRAGLAEAERMKLTPEAFKISNEINGLRVALVDDVCTTGMTLLRLAQACEACGAEVTGAYTLTTVSGD